MLIAKGAQVNATDGNGDTSLHVACQKGNTNTVDVLVENDADCNVVNVCGETLLHLACKSRVECVELCDKLISHGVNPHIADREGNLPLHVALKNRLAKTFGCLLQKSGEAILDVLQKVTIDKEDLVAIFSRAHKANDINTCGHIIKFSAKLDPSNRLSLRALNCHTTIGYLLIQRAVKEQNITFCQHLIDHGASVNAEVPHSYRDRTFKDPPLHLAVKVGRSDLCCLLIEHGATIDPKMRGRIGALHLAVVNEQKDVARLLLSHGADVSKVEISGESALKRLETRGNVKMASIIQATETFPEEIVSQGETALRIYLSSCNEGSAVDVFLRVDVVGRDGAGKTSLTKSLTLQKFNRDEPSTRGVVFDPKCQIIVKEACDWTNPLTSADYTEIYEKNVVINMADTLDTPQVKDQYFKSKESEQPMKQKDSHITSKSSKQELHEQPAPVGMELSLPHVPLNGFSQELPITSKKPTTLAVPPPSVASDLLVSSQTSSNSLPVDDSRYLSDIPVTNAKASGGTGMLVATACPVLDQIESDFRNEDNLVVKGDSKSMAGRYSVDLHSSQESKAVNQQTSIPIANFQSAGTNATQVTSILPGSVDAPSTENTTTLPQHIQERVSKILRDRKSHQKAKKEIMLTVLDYAGQNVFYVTHHLIMSKASFMYIVFNASLPMDGKTPCQFCSEDGQIIHIPLFDNETNFDRLEEWVSGVHIMEGDQSRRIMIFEKEGIRSPAMFLVGTHVDELKEQPGMMEKQDAFIRKKLEGTVLAEHIIWASKDVMCFYVDNTVTDPDSGVVDPQVKLLRQKTEDVAHKVAQHHRLPIRWLKYEQKVREVKVSYPTKKTTTVDELLQLAMNAAGIKSREELLVLLQYLSSRAVLMYHPMALKSGDDEEVVLDVEWFVSQLQKVITIYMEGDVPPMLWNDVKRSKEKGIMTMSLVRHLLSDAGSAQRLIVSLMRHYDLLCEYSVLEEENLKTASDYHDFLSLEGGGESHCEVKRDVFESKACFIPCLLEHAAGLESCKMNDELKSLPLILSSAPICIPQPLFYRVLTLLCKRFRRLAVIYRNVGYFHIYPGHRLEFALNRYNFQMTVLSETHAPLNAKVCVAVREWIVDVVDKAKQQGMPGLTLQLGFECDVSTSTSNIEFISLDGYQNSRFQLYSSVMKREVQPPLRLSLWKVKRCYPSMLPLNYHGTTVVYLLSCLYY
ncbi:uncharacterized protein LOC134188264 [Corticium candelabrum]|uniref:uncharacterized protein LOC134188264 n=1 Tax=Corticium candelabrum TaxID=121492 RepID=UPI002E252B05|nr:uncharacterized protein LOC134188264 [Corticium candelabrum]